MLKKLTLLASSVTALLAFAAPAAQAEGPLITNFFGGAAETVTGESINSTIWTELGRSQCTTANLHLDITSNANTAVHGHGDGELVGYPFPPVTHTGECRTGFGSTSIQGLTVNTIQLTKHAGQTTGTASITILVQAFGGCTFSGSAVPVTRTGTDTINIDGTLVKTAGIGCTPNMILEADYTVLDEFGAPVHIH